MSTLPISRRRNERPCDRRSRVRSRPLVEVLEGRQLLTSFTVTNNSDSTQSGSLLWAIDEANATSGTSPVTIDFNLPSGSSTIALTSPLPPITHPVVIDGTSEPGYGTSPLVVVNGMNLGSGASGFSFGSQASGSTLKGLAIVDFSSSTSVGVRLSGSSGVTVANDYVGVLAGNAPGGNGVGVLVTGGALNNSLTGDVISGNGTYGVEINDGAGHSLLTGDLIGTTTSGTAALPNGGGGVYVNDSSNNTIGGTTSGTKNTISGNTGIGVDLEDGSNSNLIEGDNIGTNVGGSGQVHNSSDGVRVNDSNSETIGGTASGAGNTISDNKGYGVTVENTAHSSVIEGNGIGTDSSGTVNLGNFAGGVYLDDASSNTIGGTSLAARNVISGNQVDGVDIEYGSDSNVVEGDLIGTETGGEVPLANGGIGVEVNDNSNSNTVGGTATGAGNTISGNTGIGVKLMNEGSTTGGANENVVQGNIIGLDETGTKPLANGSDGLVIDYGSASNTIGGTSAAARNIISANKGYGVVISTGSTGEPSDSNLVEGNFIGTDITGTAALGNAHFGVYIGGSSKNTIGGTSASAANTISGNLGGGVFLSSTTNTSNNPPTNSGSTNNKVEGNFIGTSAGGSTVLGNDGEGVSVAGTLETGNVVGGTATGAANTISDNEASGVYFGDVGSSNLVEDDLLVGNGTKPSSSTVSQDEDGVLLVSAPSSTVVTGCTIESNDGWGIYLQSSGSVSTSGNTIPSSGSLANKLGTIGAHS